MYKPLCTSRSHLGTWICVHPQATGLVPHTKVGALDWFCVPASRRRTSNLFSATALFQRSFCMAQASWAFGIRAVHPDAREILREE